jgi:hypothetical protein
MLSIPYELLRELREQAPAHWHGPADLPRAPRPEGVHNDGFWVVLGHPEIVAVNRDTDASCPATGAGWCPLRRNYVAPP